MNIALPYVLSSICDKRLVRRWGVLLVMVLQQWLSGTVSAKEPPTESVSPRKIEKSFGSRNLSFIENKGQIVDQYNQRRSDIQFSLATGGGLNIFIGKGAIHYQFSKCENPEKMQHSRDLFDTGMYEMGDSLVYSMYRMDVELVGANKDAVLIREEKQHYYENHYTHGLTGSDARAHAYNRIVYKDVYPHIDWVLYTKGRELKHEFIVHEGGRVSDIKLRYGGAQQLYIDGEGALTATTPQGTITEQAPYVYQKDGQEVRSSFVLRDSVLSYDVGSYEGVLVIDPTLEWATYLGGGDDDRILSCVTDRYGFFIVAGVTSSVSGIASSGAYSDTLRGTEDAFVVRIDKSGGLMWATYYGGEMDDFATGCAVDSVADVYVVGSTRSSTGISISGAYQLTKAGYSSVPDGFIVKFDSAGAMQWSTYYGGPLQESELDVVVDKDGYLYISGTTQSASGIATAGTHADHYLGLNDGFIAKFTGAGSRVWGTYYGDVLTSELIMRVAVDNFGGVYVCGVTSSISAMATPGAHQTSMAGLYDGFCAKFNSSGNLVWSTYYGGAADDAVVDMVVSKGYLYATGYTKSTSGISTPGAFQETKNGHYDAFVVKFTTGGSRIWGTYFGGPAAENHSRIAVDTIGGIYLAGTAYEWTGMTTTDAFQADYAGAGDVYIAKFDNEGERCWGTYFGAGGTDRTDCISVDLTGNLFLAGNTNSSDGIATVGAYQPDFHGGFRDAMIAKVGFELPPIIGVDTICLGTAALYVDSVGYGHWVSSDTSIAVFDSVDIYTGRLTAISAGSVGITYTVGEFTISKVVVVLPSAAAGFISGPDSLCMGTSEIFTASADTTGSWSSSDVSVVTADSDGMITPVGVGSAIITYAVTNSCGTDYATRATLVRPLPLVGAIAGTGLLCAGDDVTFSNPVSGGMWISDVPSIATVSTTGVVVGVTSGVTLISYTLSNDCGSTSAVKAVLVNPSPDAGMISGVSELCAGSTTIYTSTASGGSWSSSYLPVGTVSGTGLVSGLSAGTTTISYVVANSCGSDHATAVLTVNPAPDAGSIAGTLNLCEGATTALSATVSGGSWSSSDGTVASVSTSGIVSGHMAGTAIISYSLSFSCGDVAATAVVTVNPLPDAGALSGAATVCAGSTTALASAAAGGTWSSSNTIIATVSSTGTVSGISAGTATISYLHTNICGTASTTQEVTVNPLPDAGVLSGTATVCTGSTTSLISTAPGGTWTSSNTSVATVSPTGTVSGVSPGTATISYIHTNSCGTASTTQVVTVNPLPDAGTISGTVTVCSGNTTLLTSTASGGTWTSSNTSVATVSSTGVVSGITAGTTTISYSQINSCGTATATQTVMVNPLADAGALSGTATICTGNTTILTSTTSGGTWTSSNTSVATVSSTGVVSGISSGTVTISYIHTNSCGTASATHVVTVNPLPDAGTLSGTATVCTGGTTLLTSTTPGGTWTSSNTAIATVSPTGIVSGILSGTVIISYTQVNGCGTATATQTVTVNPSPDAGALSGTTTLCVSAAATFTSSVSGGVWSSSNTTIATVSPTGVVSGMSSGTATISYSQSNSCGTDVATQTVTVNPLPDAGTISGSTAVCEGSSVALTSTVSGGVWSSMSGAATVSPSGMVLGTSPGTATILYIYTNSCGTATATHTITVNPLPVAGVISGISTLCVGNSTTLTNTVTGGVWTSSNPAVATVLSSGITTALSAGTATISYTVTNACSTATAIKTVTVNPLPSAGLISGSSTVCAGSISSLSASVTGGTWTSSNTLVATISSTGVVHGVTSGTASISYNFTNSCGTATAIKTVSVLPMPVAGIVSGSASVCRGASAPYTSTLPGGVWSSSNASVASVSGAGIVWGVSPGVSVISYTVSNSCGSVSSVRTVSIIGAPSVSSIAGGTNVCVGNVMLMTATPGGGIWNSSNPVAASISSSGLVSGVSAGTSTIAYTATNSCGSNTATKVITVNALPSISGGSAISLCSGSTTTLTASPAGGSWSSSSSLIRIDTATGLVTGLSLGTGTVVYTLANGCSRTTTVTVNGLPGAITGGMSVCEGATTHLYNSTAGGSWHTSDTTILIDTVSGVVSGLRAGSAMVSYILPTGCGSYAGVMVHPLPAPVTGPNQVCTGDTILLADTTSGGFWITSDTTIALSATGSVIGLHSGIATVFYMLSTGCGSSKVITVNPVPATISGSTAVCEGQHTTLSSSPSGGVWTSGGVSIASVDSTTGVLSGVAADTTSISYHIPSTGCATTTVVTVNAEPSIVSGVADICEGRSTTFTADISGGSWHSSTSTATIDTVTGVLTAISSGTTVITYTTAEGCATSDTVTINTTPSVITGTLSVCEGQTTSLSSTPSGGRWYSGSTTVSVDTVTGVVSGLVAGTARVSYILPTGCNTSTEVTVDAIPDAINGNGDMCVGNNQLLTCGTPGGVWSSSSGTVAAITTIGGVSALSSGTSTISYILSSGCSSAKEIRVHDNPVVTGDTVICAGAQTICTTSDTTVGVWSSSTPSVATIDMSGTVNGISAGTSMISYTSAAGCRGTLQISVEALPEAGLISGDTVICIGSDTQLTSSDPGGIWQSADSATIGVSPSGIITGKTAGRTTISYGMTSGCGTDIAVVDVVVLPLSNAGVIHGTDSLCVGDIAILSATTGGGTWMTRDELLATVTDGTVTAQSEGTASVLYIISEVCGTDTTYHTLEISKCSEPVYTIRIYPNPTRGDFIVESPVSGVLAIHTIDGRKLTDSYQIEEGSNHISLASSLARGVYMCHLLTSDGRNLVEKLVLKP